MPTDRCLRCRETRYTRHGFCAPCAILLAYNPHHSDATPHA